MRWNLALVTSLLALSGCDLAGDFLFAGAIEGVPGTVHLGDIVPVDILSAADVDENVIYHELGPSETANLGGTTFTFKGTGAAVCVWVDPETVSWNQSVSKQNPAAKYVYPDNVYDDGDLDLFAGLSVFYTGAPGETVGDFVVPYEDALGNEVPVSLTVCNISSQYVTTGASSGRGSPEYCTIFSTEPDVSYTVLMKAWSTPLDDDRLGYGLVVANGTCQGMRDAVGAGTVEREECLVQGESVQPQNVGSANFHGEAAKNYNDGQGLPAPSWIGVDEVPTWGGMAEFEGTFCNSIVSDSDLADWCQNEFDLKIEEGRECEYQGPLTSAENRCFCGNPLDTPTGGAF